MPGREIEIRILDVIEAAWRIHHSTREMSYEEFLGSPAVLNDAVRNFEIIQDAIAQITPSVRAQFPQVPWEKLAGFRRAIIHRYIGVDPEILWTIIQHQLPSLMLQFRKILDFFTIGRGRVD